MKTDKFLAIGWVPEFWFDEIQILEMMEVFPEKKYVKKKWVGEPFQVKISVERL